MMLIRSTSTPILGSLLSSCSESPNHGGNLSEFNSPNHINTKLSFHQPYTSPLNLIPPSSSPFSKSSPSINAEFTPEGSHHIHGSPINTIRRAQSEGNLEGLAYNSFDEFNHSTPTKKFPRKPPSCKVLQTIPSFSMSRSNRRYEDGEEEEEEEEESYEEGVEERSGDLSLEKTMAFMNNLRLQERYLNVQEESENVPSKMHLARGLGVFTDGGGYNIGGGNGGTGQNKHKPVGYGDNGRDGASMAEYYKKMVEDNPGNPLLLRNYAEFLYKSKKDLEKAEEYYSRAILMDPGDGEILSQYAQLIWELHGDDERALSYFQRAVQVSPENSHIMAAYANFLWETEEDNNNVCTKLPARHQNAIVAAMT
ncbi:hypothetical protein SOVF_073060 [Spinacia oleracea]|uniref:Uncharacterized protein n=1 Tax=Spinacia oleracea TaxID=3562 RepID=A0A9R0IG19_SPIOL|nr:uncharacterized protein LOC110788168 [Spinacia oleracea]KNA18133.1 hypothetical protein SOVF_073060 [Spinacia oleracea]